MLIIDAAYAPTSMTHPYNHEAYCTGLVHELCKLPNETEWVEFKYNNDDPEMIGEYISALSNSAALHGKTSAYVVWGIDDQSHDIIGTTFSPRHSKVGNEEMENWILRLLSPKIDFSFIELNIQGNAVVLLQITPASNQPVQFKNIEYIRVGSYKKKLKDFAEKERQLWRVFDSKPYEMEYALNPLPLKEAVALLDYPAYFELMNLPLPNGVESIAETFAKDKLLALDDAGYWNITNLGAILFARNLEDFPKLSRKSLRVILYEGDQRITTVREQEGKKGYASGFEGLIDFVNGLLPKNEVVGKALRKNLPMFPELAVRELVANAVIHQDFTQTGNGPMVEIFDHRMEITNPGAPFVGVERLLDAPPKSRNEALASLMRRMGICEERGSGIDKVVIQTEIFQLPAPCFEVTDASTRSILFAYKDLNDMDKQEKVRAAYLHSVLRYLARTPMTNTSLRERFQIEDKNSAIASRIIKDALAENAIKPFDPTQGRKHAKYLPFWAD